LFSSFFFRILLAPDGIKLFAKEKAAYHAFFSPWSSHAFAKAVRSFLFSPPFLEWPD